MKKIIFYTFGVILLCNCTANYKNEGDGNLKVKHQSKEIYGKPSILIEKSNNLLQIKIDYNKLDKDYKQYTKFTLKDNSYYQIKEISNLKNEIIDTLYLLALSTNDTSFTYEYDSNKYPPIIPRGFDDWTYKIFTESENNYNLLKVNTVDTTFREEYRFDKDLNIYSVNIYHGSDTLMFGK